MSNISVFCEVDGTPVLVMSYISVFCEVDGTPVLVMSNNWVNFHQNISC